MEQQPQFLELYRSGLRAAADVMNATLQQTQRIHQQQLDIVRGAIQENERSGSQIAEARSIDDMMRLNTQLAGAQLQRVTEFWSNLWQSAAEAQKLVADQMQAQIAQASSRVRQGYDLTARASEEAAKIAAAQMSATANQLRETIIERERYAQSTAHSREHAGVEPRRTERKSA